MNSGPAVSETFSRDDRLRKRREFEECYASGVRVSGRHIQVFLLAGTPGVAARRGWGSRFPAASGARSQRNRVRRRLREIFRRHRAASCRPPRCARVNARPSAAAAAFTELSEDYRAGVTRALSRLPRR